MDNPVFDLIDVDFPDCWDSNSLNNVNCQTADNEKESDGNTYGLDMTTAKEWIYPTNYPVRDYQKNIVTKALFQNTLVSLPTGLGKTFIAAVVMYNFNRWYPNHKVVFMAHSKPLVAQQLEACCQIMGIPQHVTAQLNGNISSNIRKQHWETKSIFFLTPQVFSNDLTKGLVTAESIRCVVVDEAHKALGNQAFCQAIRALQPFNNAFRVLALSATPGDDMPTVKSVIENLLISHLELRTEEDADIQKYLHTKKVEAVVVSLDSKIIEYRTKILKVAEKYLQQLVKMKAIGASFGSLTSFSLVLKQKQFIANPNVGSDQRGFVLSNFSIVIALYKAIEELVIHGLRSFHNKLLVLRSGEGSKSNIHHRLAKDEDFLTLLKTVEDYIGQDQDIAFDPDVSMARLQDELDAQAGPSAPPLVYSHPKFVMLEQIITQHFEDFKNDDSSTKVIVFCKSRPCTGEICNFLNRFRPLVKPMVLIGQSQASGGSTSRGLKQSAQLEVMRKFRAGLYNTLVATCVGEEGLDVGEVDLIVNFDSSRNSNTQVQRSGRTGRKRDGRVVNLVTEGKEHQDYNQSISKAKSMTTKLTKGVKNLPLYANSSRLLPKNIQPVCQEMFLKPAAASSKKISPPVEKKRKRGAKKTEDLNSSQSKYDIRYAITKVRKKLKLPHSDKEDSDSLFEDVGAVELFKIQAKPSKILEEIEEILVDEILPTDDFVEILSKRLDAKACDLLDTMTLEEIADLVQNHKLKIYCQDSVDFRKFPFTCERNETIYEYHEIFVPSTPSPIEIPEDFMAIDWDEDIRQEKDISFQFEISAVNESNLQNHTRKSAEFGQKLKVNESDVFEEKSNVQLQQNISEPILEAKLESFKISEIPIFDETIQFQMPQRRSADFETKILEVNESDLFEEKTNTLLAKPIDLVQKSESTEKCLPDSETKGNKMLTITQAMDHVAQLQKPKIQTPETDKTAQSTEKSFIENSPSLVYTCKTRNKNESKVKKSLTFNDPPAPTAPSNFTLFNFDSDDDDLFAEDVKFMSQKQPEEFSPPKKSTLSISNGSILNESRWLTTDDKPKPNSILSFINKERKIEKTVVEKKETPATFDCFPDDLNDFFDSSPFKIIQVEKPVTPKILQQPPLKQSTPLVPKMKKNDGEKDDSDGALEAKKFQSKAETADFNLWSSDTDDFAAKEPASKKNTEKKFQRRRRRRRRRSKGNGFIVAEAELSGNDASSDDEDTSLDEMDSSFLDERLQPTQAPGIDMTAKYLATTKSPKGLIGRFKIPQPVQCDFTVFSQVEVNDDDYAQDSFCVANETEEINQELSQLEIAEMVLEKKKKRKRSYESPVGKFLNRKKRRRIIVQDSSSDEDVKIVEEKIPEPVFDPSVQPLILIGSRHISSAPEITIALRSKFQFRVEVRSCPGADFIISSRIGINRICLSDFLNGSPVIKKSLRESALQLCELFVKPVIIVEDDKNKSAPRTVGCHRDMWSKHSAKRLAKCHQAGITTLFSKNKDETAEIIARLTKKECAYSFGVVTDWTEFPVDLEARLKFYVTLPGINTAIALKMCRKFSTLASFLNTCNSVGTIAKIINVPDNVACKIFHALHSH